MAKLNIPEKQLQSLDLLAGLSDAEFASLSAALVAGKPSLGFRSFFENIRGHLKGVDEGVAESIAESVCGLYYVRTSREWSIERLLQEVEDRAREVESASFSFVEKRRDAFRIRLAQLLSLDATVGVTAKAQDLITEHQRYLCGVRVLTDLRPIFDAGADKFSAGLIIHQLAIHYHEDREHREFYVALDSSDLATLKQAILRAERKQEALRAWTGKSGLDALEAKSIT